MMTSISVIVAMIMLTTGIVAQSPNQLAYWAFDEASGTTIVDSSGSGNDGTLINGNSGTRVTGRYGQALYFDGTTSSTYVTIPSKTSNAITNGFSFVAWVNVLDDRNSPILAKIKSFGSSLFGTSYFFGFTQTVPVDTNVGFGVQMNNGQPGAGTFTSNAYRSVGDVPLGVWTHLAVTWDGATVTYYINGAFVSSLPFTAGPVIDSSAALTIGVNSERMNTFLHATIDEMRMFDGPLSADDVATLYNTNTLSFLSTPAPPTPAPPTPATPAPPTPAPPPSYGPKQLAYWAFDEGTGSSIIDSSHSGNDGTLINGNSGTRVAGRYGQALFFPGASSGPAVPPYVSIPPGEANELKTGFSFVAWVNVLEDFTFPMLAKIKSLGGGLYGYSYLFGLNYEGTGGPGFGVMLANVHPNPANWTTTSDFRTISSVPIGVWTHLAVTWDGTTVTYYMNGAYVADKPFSGPLFDSDAILTIGANSEKLSAFFHGTIDELRMFDGPLSADDVSSLYATNSAPFLQGDNTPPVLTVTHPNELGHWSFDEQGTTNAIGDSSGTGNDGTLINGNDGTRVTGRFGRGLYFDGVTGPSSTRVEIPDARINELTTGFSFTAWVNPIYSAADQISGFAYLPILAKQTTAAVSPGEDRPGYSYTFGMITPGFGVMASNQDDGPSGWDTAQSGEDPNLYRMQGNIPPNQWSHLAATWDGSAIKYYVNGAYLTELPWFGPTVFNSSATLTIGVNSEVLSRTFHGTIDEVRMFDGPLTASDIASLYGTNTAPFLEGGSATESRAITVKVSAPATVNANSSLSWSSVVENELEDLGEILASLGASCLSADKLSPHPNIVTIFGVTFDNPTGVFTVSLTAEASRNIDAALVLNACFQDSSAVQSNYESNGGTGVIEVISVVEGCEPAAIQFPSFSSSLGTACAGLLEACTAEYSQWKDKYDAQQCRYRDDPNSITSPDFVTKMTTYAQRCIALLEAYCDTSDPSYYYAPAP